MHILTLDIQVILHYYGSIFMVVLRKWGKEGMEREGRREAGKEREGRREKEEERRRKERTGKARGSR